MKKDKRFAGKAEKGAGNPVFAWLKKTVKENGGGETGAKQGPVKREPREINAELMKC